MERLGDDELHYIFNKIPEDRIKSLIQVSKRFMKVACTRLRRLHSRYPDLLFDTLPSSPNLRSFYCDKPLSNTHLNLLAHSCPNMQLLDLQGLDHVGDAGIVSLVTWSKNLTTLNIERCVRVTDESLKAIGESRIINLNLRGCCLITDLGLKYLAKKDLKNSLQRLNLSGCDKISNNGVIHLKHMVGLTRLNLSKCGVHITDSGIVPLISQLTKIEWLNLYGLINVSDISLIAIGRNCLKLERIYLPDGKAITAEDLRAFYGDQALI